MADYCAQKCCVNNESSTINNGVNSNNISIEEGNGVRYEISRMDVVRFFLLLNLKIS